MMKQDKLKEETRQAWHELAEDWLEALEEIGVSEPWEY